MDEDRRRTLCVLVELAEENTPGVCWSDQHAIELLRVQSTPEELREIGVSEAMIDHIFAEPHGG